MTAYRILVTGSRTWDDHDTVRNALTAAYFATAATAPVVLVHGACPRGADAMASAWAVDLRRSGWRIAEERHPADWDKHGRAAGPIRNRHMIDLGADLCLAFIKGGSSGATHCADLAEKCGIPTKRWTATTPEETR